MWITLHFGANGIALFALYTPVINASGLKTIISKKSNELFGIEFCRHLPMAVLFEIINLIGEVCEYIDDGKMPLSAVARATTVLAVQGRAKALKSVS
ncbi:hypothetical protein GIW41_07865 [Pseudomonas sp. PA-6-1D]|uniref:Uncharacterized protein n=1 Tax=Pseudomonas edaphica TaxID=2006980 RepID=A0A7Y8JJF6_9PSED|nr:MULTISPECIES: hypothetical protein [Pseudomonas]MCF5140753.1 hypothetical protein [Pseudomonas sp. PA-6-3C]MCF5145910.1 hypothetical protein [Pseudomonas sp. PA-6-3F]MCF5161885.1 hypothetical protein [Pseudomonas sp. PA-6-2E]MCF5175159.1 hypothetical protein [Pseudomonas sp. PA-6-1D]MCF5191443.1 hypothetical protein [Pseudomonas sp. PA-6-1H]